MPPGKADAEQMGLQQEFVHVRRNFGGQAAHAAVEHEQTAVFEVFQGYVEAAERDFCHAREALRRTAGSLREARASASISLREEADM